MTVGPFLSVTKITNELPLVALIFYGASDGIILIRGILLIDCFFLLVTKTAGVLDGNSDRQ